MVNASQQEIENALDTIDRISTNTQFGSKNLLDGSGKTAVEVPEAAAEAAAEAASTGKDSKSLAFQIGANRGQMVSIDLPSVATTELAKGVSNQSAFASLADVDVTTGQGAQDAMAVIDTAIEEIAVARGEMGAFQKNTLESNLTSLRIHTENLTAAESSIRDADIAVELAAFTRNQIMTQSATAQLAQANALPKNVMQLLASQ
jgi:flagellin